MGQEEESAEWAAYIAAKNAIEIAKAKGVKNAPPADKGAETPAQGNES